MPPENNEGELIGSQLNVDSTAEPNEVAEFQKALETPEKKADDKGEPAAKKEPVVAEEDRDDEPDEPDERSARVDTELDDAKDDAAREAIRARRREERRKKKESTANLERRLESERTQRIQLENRLRALEGTTTTNQLAQIQQAETQAANAENELTSAIQTATANSDGATVAEATRRLVHLQGYKAQLAQAKQNLEAQAKRPPQQQADPVVARYASEFRTKHSWYKGAQSSDEHSRILSAIDNTMFNEGWDPTSESYWKELERRGAVYMPERFKDVDNGQNAAHNSGNNGREAPAKRQPVAGADSKSGNGGGNRTTFRLSEARVRAMKEAGVWDDPKRREKLIKDYRDYDARNTTTN